MFGDESSCAIHNLDLIIVYLLLAVVHGSGCLKVTG